MLWRCTGYLSTDWCNAGSRRKEGVWSGSYLHCSPGFWFSIGVPTVYRGSCSHNHNKSQEIIIYLHLYLWNLVRRETRDGCSVCSPADIPALALNAGVHNWKNSPRPHTSVARLLWIPKLALMYLSVNLKRAGHTSCSLDPQHLKSYWFWWAMLWRLAMALTHIL